MGATIKVLRWLFSFIRRDDSARSHFLDFLALGRIQRNEVNVPTSGIAHSQIHSDSSNADRWGSFEQSIFPASLKLLGGIAPASPPGPYIFDEKARFDDSQTYLVPKTCLLNKRLGNADPTRIPDPYQLGFHASN